MEDEDQNHYPDQDEDQDKDKKGFESLGNLFAERLTKPAKPTKKAPAHEFQDLALSIIKDLNIPPFKKGSVFKVCKDYSKDTILIAMNDTKELCPNSDHQWKYFFKVIASLKKDKTL